MKPKKIAIEIGGRTVTATGLYHNSKDVKPGGVYFALRDTEYVAEAIMNGACAVVLSDRAAPPPNADIIYVAVPDVRAAMSLAAKAFYGAAADKMRLTAVVGTNGKTTTTYMVKHLLETAFGKNVGLIGTTGILGAGPTWDGISTLTTPDPIDLHRALACMYENGIRDVVMEVSAHAIYYKKVVGLKFASAIFTNISHDHLDFFRDFDEYKNTKISFFRGADIAAAVINADDKYGGEIADALRTRADVRSVSYSLEADSVVGTNEWAFIDKVKSSPDGCTFNFAGLGEYRIPLPGRFNVYNAAAAALAVNGYGVSWNLIKEALKNLPAVPGRFNVYDVRGTTVIIDYAHTPDGLEKLLSNARALLRKKGAKLFSVFGCGGDRDRAKRPLMGRISVRLADFTVLTSDNPRTEEPNGIIDEIERGIATATPNAVKSDMSDKNPDKYTRVTDRTAAILFAVEKAKPGDIVVIAGKGHEDYMDIGGVKIPYTDRKVLDTIQ